MNIESTYQKIINEVSLGHRGLVRYSETEITELNELLSKQIDLHKVLCLIEHSASPHSKFENSLLQILKSPIEDSLLIFALNCARKHIVEARVQKGRRLEFNFLETLKSLLYHKSPEVVEWTLRLIEGCGNKGVYFLREFDKIKPPPWKWFNAHQRAVREIIALLERRWRPIEKSKSRP